MTANSIEESEALTLDCNKLAKVAEVPGVLPCAGQNADTGEVILVAYVNEPAIACCAATLPHSARSVLGNQRLGVSHALSTILPRHFPATTCVTASCAIPSL